MQMSRQSAFGAGTGLSQDADVLKLGPHFCGIAREMGACRHQGAGGPFTKLTEAELAKWIYGQRLARGRLAGADELGEHAWNMMLDLFISEAEGRALDVTSLAIGSGAPTTTALRWIQILERRNLISRIADRGDRRRSYVEMTKAGVDLMERYFAAARDQGR